MTDGQLRALAECLRTLLIKVRVGLGDPDYNLMLRSEPSTGPSGWHWYVSLVPRVSRQAGFELGSGIYINASLPERSAQVLRDVSL